MQDIRRPQTPLFWVFHLLSANEIDYDSQGQVVYAPTSMSMFVLQIRDDHREIEP